MVYQQGISTVRGHYNYEDLEKRPQIISSNKGRIKHCMF